MFESRSDLKNKLAAAEADVTRLEAELAQSQEQAKLVIEKDQEIASLSAELLEIKEDHEAIKAELELAKSKSSEETIQALVTEEMAKCSHKPVEEIQAEDSKPQDFYAQYRELQKTNPRAAAQFWEKNESLIKSQ